MTSVTGARKIVRVPSFRKSRTRDRCFHSSDRFGGRSDSATLTSCLMNCSGFGPNALSILFAVPKRFVTTGKRLPFTRLNKSAGPPCSITRRWISASSKYGSTSASMVTRSFSRRRRSRKERRLRCICNSSASSVVRTFHHRGPREDMELVLADCLLEAGAIQIQISHRNYFDVRKSFLQVRQKVFRVANDD